MRAVMPGVVLIGLANGCAPAQKVAYVPLDDCAAQAWWALSVTEVSGELIVGELSDNAELRCKAPVEGTMVSRDWSGFASAPSAVKAKIRSADRVFALDSRTILDTSESCLAFISALPSATAMRPGTRSALLFDFSDSSSLVSWSPSDSDITVLGAAPGCSARYQTRRDLGDQFVEITLFGDAP